MAGAIARLDTGGNVRHAACGGGAVLHGRTAPMSGLCIAVRLLVDAGRAGAAGHLAARSANLASSVTPTEIDSASSRHTAMCHQRDGR